MSDDVRWLTPAEQDAWRAYLELTIRLEEVFDRGLRREGLNQAYYEILVRLSEAEGRRLRMSALAERSASSRSRLSHAVARLEEQGYVRREECPTDRRGQVCILTDAGFAKLEQTAPAHVTDVREALLDGLTPDQFRTFGALCAAVLRHLDAREG
ncbi:MAG: MarR family winged helix-turn-helix transcriptional regulator [Mycobacteriales bacterium]